MTDYAAAREAMVDCQVRPSDVTRYGIIEALLWAPRERFVPTARRDISYADTDIPVAPGRVLLAPRTFAKMIEELNVGPDDLVLDLAPGTGYSTAVLSRLVAAVVAIEPDESLAQSMQSTIAELEVDNAVVTQAAATEGDPAHGPYDAIFVNGAVEEIPTSLTDQLKDGGRLVAIFMDGALGKCRVVVRAGDTVSERFAFDASAPVLPGFEKEQSFAF